MLAIIAAVLASLPIGSPPVGGVLAEADPTDDVSDGEAPDEDLWTLKLTGDQRLRVSPSTDLYPAYVADPRRPTMSLTVLNADSDIEGAGNARNGVRLGGRFPLLQWFQEGENGGVSLDLEAGMIAQFDQQNSIDNIAWDGIYALHVNWLLNPALAVRFGVAHDSAHLGDEFIENTGRTRIGYTREELLTGASWQFDRYWRTYAEYGWAYQLRNEELMARGRAQGGLEWQGHNTIWSGRAAPYAALDTSAFEEDDWRLNVTVQSGIALLVPNSRGTFRAGVELYDGRSIFGELFQTRETHVAVGVWLDL